MYSLNAPVPSPVARLAETLAVDVPAARRRDRGDHTLVVKRLGEVVTETAESDAGHRLAARVREALAGAPAVEARVASVDVFTDPPAGPAPVVYLAVESPGLQQLHGRLCRAFDPVADLEGATYVPHVTIARGGTIDAARSLTERSIDPVEWVIDELHLHSGRHAASLARYSLPA